MGVLDKFRIKGAVRTRFNPGRNANWDWNDLITTIEANFEGDFDLPALEARAVQNTADVATNAAAIASNDVDIALVDGQATANANQITDLITDTASNTAYVTCQCACLATVFAAETWEAAAEAYNLCTCCGE